MKLEYFQVAKSSDLPDGEMKQFTVDGTDILLANVDKKIYAVGAFCTHYGAPLAKGALCGHHVICPWHHAWFDITNGDLLEPPALDALPNYEVQVKNDDIYVALPTKRDDRSLPAMSACNKEKDSRIFVIIGGGAAGYAAAQTLREDGFVGKIIMITKEEQFPYDRPNLSKDYIEGEIASEDLPLRQKDFFKAHGIEVMNNKTVKNVDHQNKKINFDTGETLNYDTALIATGGIPRQMDVPGAALDNVFVLRSLDSANNLVATVKDVKKIVIIGSSFIGMEAAASLQSRGVQVTVVAPDDVPFAKTLGSEIGKFFKSLHEEHGVTFKLKNKVKAFKGDSKVISVVLESGAELETDAVLVGIGVTPATKILQDIDLQKDGGVPTDSYLKIAEDLFAAGDIAAIPNPHTQELVRIEHWRYALQQGRLAAQNMIGQNIKFTGVPFFWTAHFGVSLRYLGHVKDWDDLIIDGDVKNKKFLAFYIKDDQIKAVSGIGRDKEMAHLEQFFKDDKMPSATTLKEQGVKTAFGEILKD